jgi:hypothetical protein
MVALVGSQVVAADETESEKQQIKRWMEYYATEASEYAIFAGDADEQRLELHAKPIFQYTNPVRAGGQHGAMFVWVADGRPLVIGSLWSAIPDQTPNQRLVTHEFHSLSGLPVRSEHAERVGRRGKVPNWSVREAGVNFADVPLAPLPAKTPALRLAQMREIAGQFTAILADSATDQEHLRLLPQPIHRYTSLSHAVFDGGLFAFVQGTDPELILLIEARQTTDGERWQFAAARFTNHPLQLRHKDQQVWTCPTAEVYIGTKPYFLYRGVANRGKVLE